MTAGTETYLEEERGGFDEARDAAHADREMPSVAEARGARGTKSIFLYAAVLLGAGLLIVLTVDLGGDQADALTAPRIVDERSRARDSTPAFPGLGFDLAPPPEEKAEQDQPPPGGETVEERTLRLARERQALEADRARLSEELEAERQARELRLEAARMQIDAARQAEAERVKRLRSSVVILDASGKEDDGAGPRDIPPSPDVGANPRQTDGAAPLPAASASPFPPALLRAIAEGQKAGEPE